MARKKIMEQKMYHTFDTYKYIKALVAQGMKEPQAEIIINSIADSREIDLSHLSTREQVNALEKATKEQLNALEKSTKEQFNALKEQMATKEDIKDLEIKMAQYQASTLKWMIATVIAFSGIIIATIPLVIKHLT
jgi:hypothetical protein